MDQYTKTLLTIITVCVVAVTLVIVGSVIIHDHDDEHDHDYFDYIVEEDEAANVGSIKIIDNSGTTVAQSSHSQLELDFEAISGKNYFVEISGEDMDDAQYTVALTLDII